MDADKDESRSFCVFLSFLLERAFIRVSEKYVFFMGRFVIVSFGIVVLRRDFGFF